MALETVCLSAMAGGTGRGAAAVLLAAAAGVAAFLYAASSGLFGPKAFRLDPQAMRYPRRGKVEFWYAQAARAAWRWLSLTPPREMRIDYWYARAARWLWSFLARAGWAYAQARKRTWAGLKRGWRRARGRARAMLPEAARGLQRDMALGALAMALVLVALLLLSLA